MTSRPRPPAREDVIGRQPARVIPLRRRVPEYEPTVPGTACMDIVRARRFELVDAAGHVRGGLGFTDEGDPGVILCDAGLKVRAELVLGAEGPALVLCDANGKPRLALTLKNSASAVQLINHHGKPRLVLTVDGRGRVQAAAFGRRGQSIAFVMRKFEKQTARAFDRVLEPLARASKKREFLQAAADVFGIFDRQEQENMWRVAERAVQIRR